MKAVQSIIMIICICINVLLSKTARDPSSMYQCINVMYYYQPMHQCIISLDSSLDINYVAIGEESIWLPKYEAPKKLRR